MMPPPPPPPQPAPGPTKGFIPASKSGTANVDRGALLSSIQKGSKLKKTVTNDRSSPLDGKTSKTSSNGSIQGPTRAAAAGGGGGMGNGAPPQLAGLFAGGMPKLRSTGRGVISSTTNNSNSMRSTPGHDSSSVPSLGKKSSAPPTPPGSAKPFHSSQSQLCHSSSSSNQSLSSAGAPPSPKPSIKSNPAPPPPPSNRKPAMLERGNVNRPPPQLEIPPPPVCKPTALKTMFDSNSSSEDRHRTLPSRPVIKTRLERGPPPPRPPSSSKPYLLSKSPDIAGNGDLRRTNIDRSLSMREPARGPVVQTRVGTSAESPAAPFRINSNHREAPPVPASRPPVSKTVGRAAGVRMMPALRPPSDRPPKPPTRPVVAAPPPPSQPPPPPPPHRTSGSSNQASLGHKGNAEVPLMPMSPVPPPPPERNESTRATSSFVTGKHLGEFESRFSSSFKSHVQFPLPLMYKNVPKIYPSKNNAKNQRRAPLPPTSSTSSSQANPAASGSNLQNDLGSTTRFGVKMSHPHPPPQPPHAPLHLQMDRKFYGAEASHC